MKAEVKAVKHKDVRGKEMLYLSIAKEGFEPVIINIGSKTFEAVHSLEGVEQLKLDQKTQNEMDNTKKTR